MNVLICPKILLVSTLAFQRTDYEFVCCVLLGHTCTVLPLGITVWYKWFLLYYEMIFIIYLNENSYENMRTYYF